MSTRTVSSLRTIKSVPPNLQIAVGSYTGDGTDSRNITSVGFQPNFVFVKGGSNPMVWRSSWQIGDSTSYLSSVTANTADLIQSFLSNGFQVGTNASVNTNGTTYYWLAIRGNTTQNYFRTGFYKAAVTGTSWIHTDATVNFTPDMIIVKRDAAVTGVWNSSAFPSGQSGRFENAANDTNAFSSIVFNGFISNTATRLDQVNGLFYWVFMKSLTNVIAVGTYTGNGIDNRNINIGFQPNFVWVKGNGGSGFDMVLRTSDYIGDSSSATGGAATSNMIQGFNSTGFQIGTDNHVNGNNTAYYWFALKAGNYNIPITRSPASGRTAI